MLVDYSYPLMMAEKALKDVYNLMLHGKPEEALEEAKRAMDATSEAIVAIRVEIMKKS